MNIAKTSILLAAMTALLMFAGAALGGEAGLVIALLVSGTLSFLSYWNSDKVLLAMHHAREADQVTAPNLQSLVVKLADRAEMPVPRIYIIDSAQPNAFATGRNPENAAVAVTTGLLRRLSRDEIEAVVAHELAHIKNYDTLLMTATATIAGAISMLAHFAFFMGGGRNNTPFGFVGMILVILLAPFAAVVVQMAISRTREYAADRTGARICGKPLALATALEAISTSAEPNEGAVRHPETAHLFIVNPIFGQRFGRLFSTHPKTERRIAALRQLSIHMRKDQDGKTSSAQSKPGTAPWSRAGKGDTQGPWG